jgi:hypothetical protein
VALELTQNFVSEFPKVSEWKIGGEVIHLLQDKKRRLEHGHGGVQSEVGQVVSLASMSICFIVLRLPSEGRHVNCTIDFEKLNVTKQSLSAIAVEYLA